MIEHKITGFRNGSVHVTTSGTTYDVSRDAVIIASSGEELGAIYEDRGLMPPLHDNTYNIEGRLVGYKLGIHTTGVHETITIGVHGEISGEYAVDVEGDGSVIANHGQITSQRGYGIYDSGPDSRVDNFGTIFGLTAFADGSAAGVTFINEASGRVFGAEFGVSMLESASTKFINHGLVHCAGSYAVVGGVGSSTVINDGTIEGNIDLGDGQDVLDTRDGAIHGSIFGGAGDDILVTDNADYKLIETADGGANTIVSTVSYKLPDNVETLILRGKGNINGTGTKGRDTLIGNAGDNKLVGGVGFDTLVGGKGDDELIGDHLRRTSAPDTFVFSTGGGHDKVMDYIRFDDTLDFTNWQGIDNLDAVVSHAHDVDDGLLIRLGDDSLLINGYTKADLTQDGWTFKF